MNETNNKRWLTPEFFANPYPFYAELLANDPVHWSEALNNWVLTRYEQVNWALRHTNSFSNARRMVAVLDEIPEPERAKFKPLYNHFSVGLIHADPPEHTRLRRLLNKVFTEQMAESMRPRVEVLVNGLLDEVQAEGGMDVIEHFAFPLPATVICEILGVPVEKRDQVRDWSEDFIKVTAATCPMSRNAEPIQKSVLEMRGCFAALIEERRKEPREDLISLLAAAEEEGDRLSMEELLTTAVTLLVAGHETTTNLIGNGLLTLLRHPEQLHRLRENPALMPDAIEEILRYEGPVQRLTRMVKEDVEILGKEIRKGQVISAMIGAANRDPAVFPEPHRFDITRQNNRHVAFGFGIHFCIGARLARLEGAVALNAILQRFPNLKLATEQVEWRPHSTLRSLKALTVRF